MESLDDGEKTKNSEVSFQNHRENLLLHLGKLRLAFNPKISNGKMLTIIQENPCYLKCFNDIRYSKYNNNNIDPFYSERHRYVKTKLIDSIVDEFGHLVKVTSEQSTSTGKLDISVISENKILLASNRRRIAIEIKTGKSINLFQIERYLIDSDQLIMIRVPTEEVITIRNSQLKAELIKSVLILTRKTQRLADNDTMKIQGEWCRGCTAICEHNKFKSNIMPPVSIQGLEQLMKNVDAVVEKVINILRDEFSDTSIDSLPQNSYE